MDSRVYPESECTPKLDSLAQILSRLGPHDLRTCAGLSRGPRWGSESRIRMASHGIMDCIRLRGRARYADVDSGPALFRTATHQESRIHADGGYLTGARHWSDYGGIQRDLRRADGPLPLPRGGPHRADDGEDQGRLRGNGQFELPADSAVAASARDRELAGDGLPR